MKRYAPSTQRNHAPIGNVLAKELPDEGTVLEIASGTGEHAVRFSQRFPYLRWQPSDCDADALASIESWRESEEPHSVLAPIKLDASAPDWPIEEAQAILCINMVHISPWAATEGLFTGAARVLVPGAPLILYGPYRERDVPTALSNEQFELWLKERDERFGLRWREDVDALAGTAGLKRTKRYQMPANNIMLVYRKA